MTNDEKRLLALQLVRQAIELSRESLASDHPVATHLEHCDAMLERATPKPDAPNEDHH